MAQAPMKHKPSSPGASSRSSTHSSGNGSVGISGILLREDLGLFQITSLDPAGPARKSGMVQENDCLVKVAGKDLKGMGAEDVKLLLRGAVGSKVRIRVSRGGDTFDCTLMRTEVVKGDVKKKRPPSITKTSPPDSKAPRRLTDKEKAERVAGGRGNLQERLNRKIHRNHDRDRATEEEARMVNERERKLHDEAQRKADEWYEEQVQRDEEEKKRAIQQAFEKKQPWNVLGILGMGGQPRGEATNAKDESFVSKMRHTMDSHYQEQRHNFKSKKRDYKEKATINIGMAVLNYRMRKAGNELEAFFVGKPVKKQGFFRGRQPQD